MTSFQFCVYSEFIRHKILPRCSSEKVEIRACIKHYSCNNCDYCIGVICPTPTRFKTGVTLVRLRACFPPLAMPQKFYRRIASAAPVQTTFLLTLIKLTQVLPTFLGGTTRAFFQPLIASSATQQHFLCSGRDKLSSCL